MMSRGKSFLLGFMIGGAATTIATLLSTPSSGKDLRRCVKKQSIEWRVMLDNEKQDALNLKTQVRKTSKEGVALISDLTQEMRKSVEDWKSAVEPHQENIQEYLEHIELSIKDLEEKVKNK